MKVYNTFLMIQQFLQLLRVFVTVFITSFNILTVIMCFVSKAGIVWIFFVTVQAQMFQPRSYKGHLSNEAARHKKKAKFPQVLIHGEDSSPCRSIALGAPWGDAPLPNLNMRLRGSPAGSTDLAWLKSLLPESYGGRPAQQPSICCVSWGVGN